MADAAPTCFTPAVPLDFNYNYRLGAYLEKYLDGLKEHRITGVRCPGCQAVLVPPRMYCGSCRERLDQWVEVGQEGELVNFTVGHVNMDKGRLSPAGPYVIGLVRLDGATSPLLVKVENVEPPGLETGLRVKAVWDDAAETDYLLLSHFEPV